MQIFETESEFVSMWLGTSLQADFQIVRGTTKYSKHSDHFSIFLVCKNVNS